MGVDGGGESRIGSGMIYDFWKGFAAKTHHIPSRTPTPAISCVLFRRNVRFVQVPETVPEPLTPITRKLLPSQNKATEAPTTFSRAILEPFASPVENAFVPFVSCEQVNALAYAVELRNTKNAPGQLAAKGIT